MKFRSIIAVLLVVCLTLMTIAPAAAAEIGTLSDGYDLVLESRFPAIEEDEPPYRLLCTEYPEAKD